MTGSIRPVGALTAIGFAALVIAVGLSLASSGPGKAWIDQPLPDTVFAVGTSSVAVTAHAADPDGVVAVRLDVDGATVATVETDGSALVTAQFTWMPPTEGGTFGLSVWGRDTGGQWSSAGVATVTVIGAVTTTATTVPAPTTTVPAPTTTVPAPTTTACDQSNIAAPTLVSPPHNATGVDSGSVIFTWTYSGCAMIDRFQLQVSSVPSMEPSNSYDVDFPVTSYPGDVSGCSDIYWRVKAWRADTEGQWSPTRTFKTECAP